MKNKFLVQTVTWLALIWILASVIWVWYTVLFPSNPSTELTEEQENALKEMFWENWKEEMQNSVKNTPEWEDAEIIEEEIPETENKN